MAVKHDAIAGLGEGRYPQPSRPEWADLRHQSILPASASNARL